MINHLFKILVPLLFLILLLCFSFSIQAEPAISLQTLHVAYPDYIESVTPYYIVWKDGTRMPIQSTAPLLNWATRLLFHLNPAAGQITLKEMQRQHYESVFKKMYGRSAAEVQQKLRIIYWMPHIYGTRYPLKVTTVNSIDKKLERISAELEKLPLSYFKFLANPAGSFYWRHVKGESYLSAHSFGIAIDINSHYSNYWLWDYQKTHHPLTELRYHKLIHHNRVPMRIVEIFEKEGFYWGGRWYFYDTMHFEYRPDLLV
jgi:hypothetical protein